MDHDAAPVPFLPLQRRPVPFRWEDGAIQAAVAQIRRRRPRCIHYLGHADPGLLRGLVSIAEANISVTDMDGRWRSGAVEVEFDCGPGKEPVSHRPGWASLIRFFHEGMPQEIDVALYDRWPEDRCDLIESYPRLQALRLLIVHPGCHRLQLGLGRCWFRREGVWFGVVPPSGVELGS